MSFSNPRTRRMSMTYSSRKKAKTAVSTVTRAAEVKELLGQATNVSIVANGTVVNRLCNNIVKGTQGNERVGNRIRLKSIEVTGTLGVPQGNSNTATLFRSEANTAFNTQDILGPFIYKESGAMYDYFINDSAGGGTTFKMKKTFPGLGMEIKFDKDTGDTNTGPALLFVNQNATAQTGGIYWWKLRYYDV